MVGVGCRVGVETHPTVGVQRKFLSFCHDELNMSPETRPLKVFARAIRPIRLSMRQSQNNHVRKIMRQNRQFLAWGAQKRPEIFDLREEGNTYTGMTIYR